MKKIFNTTKGSTTGILITILAVIVVLAIAYVGYNNRSNSGNNLAGVSYEVSTDKTEYTQNDPIVITITINNKTNEEKTFSFNNGCQGSYEVAGFDLSKHVECIQSLSSFTVPPQTAQEIKVTHYPSLEKLPVGTHELTGKIIGYGEAKTTITITDGMSESKAKNASATLWKNYVSDDGYQFSYPSTWQIKKYDGAVMVINPLHQGKDDTDQPTESVFYSLVRTANPCMNKSWEEGFGGVYYATSCVFSSSGKITATINFVAFDDRSKQIEEKMGSSFKFTNN